MKTLKAPSGIKDVNFEGVRYTVDQQGCVNVPDQAVLTLYQFGFTDEADTKQPNNKNTAKTS